MTDFNWSAYGRWENKKEWGSEPNEHDDDCECYLCDGYTISHMRENEKLERWDQRREEGQL